MPVSSYEILIRGRIGEMILSEFPAFVAEPRGSHTLLRGDLADPAALYGLVAQLEALGLVLEELRLVRRDAEPPHSARRRRSSAMPGQRRSGCDEPQ